MHIRCGIVVLVTYVSFIYCDLFTAIIDLEKLLHTEHHLADDIRGYIDQEQIRLQELKRIADDYEAHSKAALSKGADNYLANPVNAFVLVKRFTTDWLKVEDLLRKNTASEVLDNLRSKSLPESNDLKGAAQALLRLQDTYELTTEKLVKGEIQGAPNSAELTASDCFQLGQMSYTAGDHYHTILWMTQALEMMKGMEPQHPEIGNAYDHLSYSAYMQGNINIALALTQEWLKVSPNHERAQNNVDNYSRMLSDRDKHSGLNQEDNGEVDSIKAFNFKNEREIYRTRPEFKDYERLCRGEVVVPNPDTHKLYCEYSKPRGLHYFQLRPLKAEVIFLDPKIVLFHDVMTDSEIIKLQEITIPKLKSSTVFNPQTGELETAHYRVSKSAWLDDFLDPVVERITHRVASISGFTMDTVEPLQVVNYGIGGHYDVHYDFARKDEPATFDEWRGNRIATAMFYLSDVIAGGATVFTKIGVTVYPEKGAMILWYNLHRNGDGDMRTRHAACPVLAGRKWVANKWIHERGQDFTHYNCDDNLPEDIKQQEIKYI